MLISFSKNLTGDDVASVARLAKIVADVKWTKGNDVRFTLPDATVAEHDTVIRALLTTDPDARVRTSRATYENLADFESQLRGRVS